MPQKISIEKFVFKIVGIQLRLKICTKYIKLDLVPNNSEKRNFYMNLDAAIEQLEELVKEIYQKEGENKK